MRIGIVSDTHNNLKSVAKIVSIFNAEAVDKVVHTGDITQAKTIHAFAALEMPMFGVFGNNDMERESLDHAIAECGFSFYDPPFEIVWAERKIIVVHDPLEFDGHLNQQHELALHGHTHRYRLETTAGGTVLFNPGECAGMMNGLNAIGTVDLSTLTTQIIKF